MYVLWVRQLSGHLCSLQALHIGNQADVGTGMQPVLEGVTFPEEASMM